MKFEALTADHVRQAVLDLQRHGLPEGFRESTGFDVEVDGELYPPKVLAAYANERATGEPPVNDFKGGRRTDCFKMFERLGFRVIPKTDPLGLSEYIERYKLLITGQLNLELDGREYNELYKWETIQHFQDNWDDSHNGENILSNIEGSFLNQHANNLWSGVHYLPYKALTDFAAAQPDAVSQMMRELFDESRPLLERMVSFMEKSVVLKEQLHPGKDNWDHYQSRRAILLYLALKYPSKYFLYKKRMFDDFCKISRFWPPYGRGAKDDFAVVEDFQMMCEALKKVLKKDTELLKIHRNRLPDTITFDDDDNLLVQDFMYSVGTYLKPDEADNEEFDQRLLSMMKTIGYDDVHALFEIMEAVVREIGVREGDERVTYSLPKGGRFIGLTIGQKYAVIIERQKSTSRYHYFDTFRDEKDWLHEVDSMEEIRRELPALIRSGHAELDKTRRSGFRQNGSVALEKAIFHEDYREMLLMQAFGVEDKTSVRQHEGALTISDKLNQIFFGPPGTGKTFSTVNAAIEIVDSSFYSQNNSNRAALRKRFQELLISESDHADGQIGFATFHQSMSYEDFIEGIKPSKPREGDTYLKYEIEEGIFMKMCQLAKANEGQNYVLIIDEINRGNVSAIFGELITLIEPNKRAGADEALEVVLPYSKANFSVPKNLYIIGTMNTADRSVEALDSALRRRFAFTEMAPDANVIAQHGEMSERNGILEEAGVKVDLVKLLETINARIEVLRDKDCLIGHSYLMEVSTLADLRRAFKDKIIPLLQEYFFADLGKLSLILGPSFVTSEGADRIGFAKGHDYDHVLVNELQERKVYRLTSPDTWDFEQILA